ncbi:nuclear transport factor 2 family protein [Lentzea guizhouensis]|uniref:YybH family protein n=1 Tax=Lentzea guizhouensis TaxID=1586287 RepID=UPI0008FF6A12|nr:nuclear transport factor 2 family protein [Lentzea guizhouensis]
MTQRTLAMTVDEFVEAFNDNDLDRVMAFFADDAEYEPGDGGKHRGRDAIRAEFAPQFAGRYGAMRFDVYDKLVDEPGRRAAIRWACRIDISKPRPRGLYPLLRLLGFLRYGSRMVWHGMDVFHFDADGSITGKYSYANFKVPPMKRDREKPWRTGVVQPA